MKFKCFVVLAAALALNAVESRVMAQQAGGKTPTGVANPVAVPAQDATKTAPVPAVSAAEAEVLAANKELMDAFNKGDSVALLNMFLPDAELIDDEGTVYLGKDEIGALFKAFVQTYPEAKTQGEIESVRMAGGLAMVDGTRVTTQKDGTSFSVIRYSAIWKKTDAGYKLVSMRDVSEAIPATPKEALENIAWIVGSWVNEGTDGKVELQYRWAEDANFIVGDIAVVAPDGKQVMKSFQRIAWDAAEGKYRSWTFDSDGGWGDALWNETDSGWVLVSRAVTPEGMKGSALVRITPESNDRFVITGTHRLTDGAEDPDYQHTVVRRPPDAAK